jgi:diaminohydroxyphosphoribosylaminopyrimidine deaminase / 5-amino-6-(5-phosphoribosylamino)uracil reductase
MQRCLQLAALGAGHVAPNPMVGAVLVYQDRIIGEGYHKLYGTSHAEVNCINSVAPQHQSLINESTLYVSLEPCSHFGKTPPCADLIIEKKIPRVVVACRDPFPQVNGKGIEKLEKHGIEVIQDVLQKEGNELNKRFFTFHKLHRPYIVLKWAQTGDGKIANEDYSRIYITNEFSNRHVHKWRSEEASILVGANTALFDDPQLTTRLWNGPNPIRLVIDPDLRLPSSLHLFDGRHRTIVFNTRIHEEHSNLLYYQVSTDANLVHQVIHALYQLNIQSTLVEGGAKILQSFIDEGYWDEARIITNPLLRQPLGLSSPVLTNERFVYEKQIGGDSIHYYTNQSNSI